MSRLSTLAVSTFRPALNVWSTTLPDSTFFSLVRTNAPPLPGLTCWNSMTFHSWPSMLEHRAVLDVVGGRHVHSPLFAALAGGRNLAPGGAQACRQQSRVYSTPRPARASAAASARRLDSTDPAPARRGRLAQGQRGPEAGRGGHGSRRWRSTWCRRFCRMHCLVLGAGVLVEHGAQPVQRRSGFPLTRSTRMSRILSAKLRLAPAGPRRAGQQRRRRRRGPAAPRLRPSVSPPARWRPPPPRSTTTGSRVSGSHRDAGDAADSIHSPGRLTPRSPGRRRTAATRRGPAGRSGWPMSSSTMKRSRSPRVFLSRCIAASSVGQRSPR